MELDSLGYETTLVGGSEGPDEGDMDRLAEELGVEPVLISSLRRNLERMTSKRSRGWSCSCVANGLRSYTPTRPRAKLGRLATLIAFPSRRSRPVLIQTFHGHSLSGYFSARTARTYRAIERALA